MVDQHPSPHRPSPTIAQVPIPRSLLRALRPHARSRRSSVQRLIIDLLKTIAQEQPSLVQAIIDDDR